MKTAIVYAVLAAINIPYLSIPLNAFACGLAAGFAFHAALSHVTNSLRW